MSFLDDMLKQVEDTGPKPIMFQDGEYTYVLRPESDKEWHVKKFDGSDLKSDYQVKLLNTKWMCNCPAAFHGRMCKHVMWISTIHKFVYRKRR